jgi:predicted oxidoreductase (fatty acid repression mutant protein)
MSARFSSLLRSTASARRPLLSAKHSPLFAVASPIVASKSIRTYNAELRSTMSTQTTQGKETPFLEAVIARRTNYTLTPKSSIPDSRIQEILKIALENAPSTFGSYTTRLVLLLKDEHFKFWDTATEVVKAVTPPEQFDAHTKPRLEGFRNAYGTVLFFEDPENTRKLQEQFAFAKDHFPVWAQHTSAIHQFIIWTAFTNEGLGVSLQHYNPLIDEKVQATWNVPAEWTLVAQMPFGVPAHPPQPKPVHMKKPLEERLFVYGA